MDRPPGVVDARQPSPVDAASSGEGEGAGKCANCGAALHGRFCSRCGQDSRARLLPFHRFVAESTGDLLNVDSRVFRTLRALLRPGALTRDYLAGRRVPYVPPLRLALTTSVVLLLALALRVPGRASAITAQSTLQDDLGLIVREHATLLSVALLLVLPLFALMLEAAYGGARRLYMEHLVLALHFHAFASLAEIAAVLLSFVLRGIDAAGVLLLGVGAANAAWLLFALRRVYGGSWPRTLLAWALLAAGYAVLVAVAFTATAGVVALAT